MSNHLVAIASVNSLIGQLFTSKRRGDLADRLTSTVTVSILAVSSAVLLSSHYWGEPITCWAPAQFTKLWIDFVNQYCYVHGTYFVPFDAPLDWNNEQRRHIPINYYQWVPYVFAVQALLFYLPRFIWKCLSVMSGFDLSAAVTHIDNIWTNVRTDATALQDRLAKFETHAAPYIWDSLILYRKRSRLRCQLSVSYLLCAFIQTVNVWLQWLWLNRLLESTLYTLWGPSIVNDLANGIDWQISGHFPRVTHCDFSRRRPASVQMDTVLCVLTLNIYYEKIFIFLWFWMLFIAIISLINTIQWCIVLIIPRSFGRSLIRKYIDTTTRDIETVAVSSTTISNDDLRLFNEILGDDGLFVLRQIAIDLGHLPVSYLTRAMYTTMDVDCNMKMFSRQSGSRLIEKLEKQI